MSNPKWINYNKFQTMGLTATAEKAWSDAKTQKLLEQPFIDKNELLKLIRKGIPDHLKGQVYAKLLQVGKLNDFERDYGKALARTYGAVVPDKPVPPTFGGRINFSNSLSMTSEGNLVVDHVLAIIAHDYPNLEYCPMLPALCHLLGHFASDENMLLGLTVSLVKINYGNADDATSISSAASGQSGKADSMEKSFYFPVSNKEFLLLSRSFGNLVYKNSRKLHAHLVKLHKDSPAPLWSRWFADMFIDSLPQFTVWRFLDLYMANGYRGLFQFGMALLEKFKSKILSLESTSQFNDFFFSPSQAFADPRVAEDIFQAASKMNLRKLDASKLADHHPILNRISSEDLLAPQSLRYQRGMPKFISSLVGGARRRVSHDDLRSSTPKKSTQDLLATSTVIQSDYWIALWSWIPPQKRLDSIELIFTTREHGTHLSTLYRLTENISPMILIVETLDGGIFGAYLSQPWILDSSTSGQFYGNGESFLFILAPYAKMFPWVGRLEMESPNSQISENSKSYGANLFVQSLADSLTIGGGGSEFGLYLEELLVKGETGRCKTFDNEPLTAGKPKKFDIHTVEVFAFR